MEINLGADTAGLYPVETATGEDSSKDGSAGESDYEKKRGKKEGKLGAKKKEKEDKKKDKQSYATLEGDSSPEDYSEMESLKSPFKGKKRSFKFSSRKDKKSKDDESSKKTSSPKEVRESEVAEAAVMTSSDSKKVDSSSSDKKKEKKEKEKKEKEKKESKAKEKDVKAPKEPSKLALKIKGDKKSKSHQASSSLQDELPIFGAPLELAVQRGRCHDGVDLPAVVRCCIDYIEEHGLLQEGIYRSSGLKTRVVELRRAYNNRENVSLQDVDPPVVASLLKQYLRELPDNILTNELLPKFEEASAIKDTQQQEEAFRNLVQQLPPVNRILLSWLMVHMEHVVEKERVNKMSVQNLSIVLCPTLNLTHRVMACFFAHSRALFSQTHVTRYIPPLSGFGVILPEELPAMAAELKKQESLLAQIHGEMSVGSVAKHREEQLWEAQRIVTQLKRQLKHHHPPSGTSQPTAPAPAEKPAEKRRPSDHHDDEELRLELAQPVERPEPTVEETTATAAEDSAEPATTEPLAVKTDQVAEVTVSPQMSPQHVTVIELAGSRAPAPASETDGKRPEKKKPIESVVPIVLDSEKELELALMIENLEREKIIQQLNEAIEKERQSVEQLQELLAETAQAWTDSSDEEDVEISEEGQEQLLAEILRENRELEEQNMMLQLQIEEAREACLRSRVQLRLREERAKLMTVTASGMC